VSRLKFPFDISVISSKSYLLNVYIATVTRNVAILSVQLKFHSNLFTYSPCFKPFLLKRPLPI